MLMKVSTLFYKFSSQILKINNFFSKLYINIYFFISEKESTRIFVSFHFIEFLTTFLSRLFFIIIIFS